MNTLHVKKGDTVVILSGKDKGKQGKVETVLPKAQKVVVEGVNIVKKHQKPRRQGEVGLQALRRSSVISPERRFFKWLV